MHGLCLNKIIILILLGTQLNSLVGKRDNAKVGVHEFEYSILFSNLMEMYKFETTSFKIDFFHCLS